MNVFGFEISRKKPGDKVGSVVAPTVDDGATLVNSAAAYYGLTVDLNHGAKNEADLIRRYREAAHYSDCDAAITDIVNEAIVPDSHDVPVSLILDDVKVSESIRKKIHDEFDQIIRLYKFRDKGHDIFHQWYVDGRIYFNIILDEKKPKQGIQELRLIDPRKIKKIKDIKREKNAQGIEIIKEVEEYYIYNDKGLTGGERDSLQGIKMSVDSVIACTSGLNDSSSGMILSYLNKAIKPVNQLKMMEDALVIYRISRAPERRIFYIDVGNLPKVRAEQYVNDIMNKFRNKVVYDAATGEVKDNRQHLSMMEDFWMPRREGGKGTEITTLAGGQNLGQIEDVQYFQTKLYQALNVPLSRLQPQQNFSLGRASEITREEIKFNNFVERLRKKFSGIFYDALRVQLIAKGIIREDEWDAISYDLRIDYQKDNHFTELKNAEILNNRLATLQNVDPYVGKYFSVNWIRKTVLNQTEDDIKTMDKEMEEDRENQIDFASHEGEVVAAKQQSMGMGPDQQGQQGDEQ